MKDPFFPERIYHVWTHANGKENLFRHDSDYTSFFVKYSKHIFPVADTFAYNLLPNHLHLVVQIRTMRELFKHTSTNIKADRQLMENTSKYISQQFSNLFNSYTKSYNFKYEQRGSLFIPNVKRNMVDSDDYLTNLISYVHNNPVHHGLCTNLLDWPHSSIHSYLTDKSTKLNKRYLIDWLGSKEELMKFHNIKGKLNLEL